MPTVTTFQDRVIVTTLAKAGLTDSQIAQRLNWSLSTVRKWRRRGQQQPRAALASRLGRPPGGPLDSYPSAILETLQALRTAHPGWGPKTLRVELGTLADCRELPLPSRSSIARWLKAEGLTRRYERHRDLPQPGPLTLIAPHQEWEMDARGHQYVPDVGVIALIDLNDTFSKVRLLSYPCWLGAKRATRYPTTEDYQLVLRLAFSEWGLPERLAVDHDSVFTDNQSKSPFPTRLHLWLLALGVDLTFGRSARPTDQAITERSHQTWANQVLVGQRFDDWQLLWEALRARRDFLNQCLPCASLGEVPPLVAHPAAKLPRRPYRPEWEADLLELARVFGYLAEGCWYRRMSRDGTVALGGQIYTLGRAWARAEVEITFDPTDERLVFRSADGERTARLALREVTTTALMGEMGPLARLDGFQLALPFSWPEWRLLRLSETMVI